MMKQSRSDKLDERADKAIAKEAVKREKEKQKRLLKIKAVQSFSPVRDVDENGVITTKDGRFLKILELSPINLLLRSADEQDTTIANFAMALKAMPHKLQFKIVSRKTDVTDYIRSIERDMATETSEKCLEKSRAQIDLIRQIGWERGVSRRFFVVIEYENQYRNRKPSKADIVAWLDSTANRIASMMNQCENVLISPQYSDEYTLAVLYGIMCRAESQRKAFETRKIETTARYLSSEKLDLSKEQWIPVNEFICPRQIDTSRSPRYIIVDGLYYTFAYIPGGAYPIRNVAGWLSLLVNIGEGVDVDFFVKKEPVERIQSKLSFRLRANKSRMRHAEDSSADYEEISSALDAAYYLRSGLANGDDFCYMATLLTITATSLEELENRTVAIRNFLIAHDLRMKECWFQQEAAFLMSLPLCKWDENIFEKAKRNVLTSSLASAYPFVSFEVADENGVFWGVNKAGSSLVFLDNFDTNQYSNANMAILGMTGAGKTYTLQCIATRMREKHQQVFIIAPVKGHEFRPACEAVGGQYIRISGGSEHCINIMEIRKRDASDDVLLSGGQSEGESILSLKVQQLHTFMSLLVPDLSYEERQLLDEAIMRTYAEFGITDDNASLDDPDNPGRYKTMPILSDLHEQLLVAGEPARRLYNILTRFVTGSAKGFCGQTNVNLDNPYIVLDVSSLTKEMLPIGMFVALDYVWDKAREDRTKRKAVILDELWTLIGAKGTRQSADFVLDIFKLIRGYGGAAIAATQDLNDFFAMDNGTYGKAIINNSRIKFVLKLESDEAKRVGEALKLSRIEVKELTRFDRGEGLLVANSNHIMIQIKATQVEHDLITTDPNDLRRLAAKQKAVQKNTA